MAEGIDTRLLPSWLKAYLVYTHASESPEEYHLWVGLSTIAGAIRRKAFFSMGYFLLYPNLYTVLVGPPGRCKKSTAMAIGRRMLNRVEGINFTTDSVTREALILHLSQSHADGHSSMTAFSSEFASLLTSSGMDQVVFLTDIYECPPEWTHKSKMGGTQKIKAPYLNLLGATTPDWIARSLPLDTVGIGLTSRIIFVYQDTPRRRPAFPHLTKEQRELEELLVHDLQKISTISGEFVLEPSAKQHYEGWYESRIENTNPTGDSRLAGYFERKPMHLLKIAMLVAASHRQECEIIKSDLDEALALLATIEERMPKVFSAVGRNPLAYDQEQMMNYILTSPVEVSQAQLCNMFKHNLRKEEVVEVLEMLVTIRVIQARLDREGVWYKATITRRD